MNFCKLALAATFALSALAVTSAHAGTNVQWQVTVETPKIRLPGHVVVSLPPVPVPRAVVVAQGREPRYWDADRDGIPNRYDRVYNPRWDRDGDGIPNRYDAYPNDPRNGRGWHHHRDWRDDNCREDRRDDRRDWRDDRRDGHDGRRH